MCIRDSLGAARAGGSLAEGPPGKAAGRRRRLRGDGGLGGDQSVSTHVRLAGGLAVRPAVRLGPAL
eukprot:4399152-Alexandrium_andersonii.AAC.1